MHFNVLLKIKYGKKNENFFNNRKIDWSNQILTNKEI